MSLFADKDSCATFLLHAHGLSFRCEVMNDEETAPCSFKIQDLGLNNHFSLQFNQKKENIIINSNTTHVMATIVQQQHSKQKKKDIWKDIQALLRGKLHVFPD